MGKYFDGKHFNYISTGKIEVSTWKAHKLFLANRRDDQLDRIRRSYNFMVRLWKTLELGGRWIVWRNRVNTAIQFNTPRFNALENRVNQWLKYLNIE